MAEISSWLPGAVSAVVSVGGAGVSTVMWVRARGERREAAKQAKNASDAAVASAGHLSRIAEVQVEQHETATAQLTAEERDPWEMDRGHNEATIYNRTSTPKYTVKVEIKIDDDDEPWTTDEFDYVGPRRQVELEQYTGVFGPMSATITWHLVEHSDEPPHTQVIKW